MENQLPRCLWCRYALGADGPGLISSPYKFGVRQGCFRFVGTIGGVNADDFERPSRVVIAEDDETVAQVLSRTLRIERYDVRVAEDGPTVFERVESFSPDVVVMDSAFPDGVDVVQSLRADFEALPVLVLADEVPAEDPEYDLLVKPVKRLEFLDRLQAMLARHPLRGAESLTVGDLRLNPDTHEVRRADRTVDLTQREFELLEYLMRHEGETISNQRLLDDVWSYDPATLTNTIQVFVSNLRKKLESGGEPRLLHTKRGEGYILCVGEPV